MDKSIVPVNQLAVRSSTCYEFSNSNPPEVVEIEDDDTSVGTVEKQMEDLKLDHQFDEKDVPEIFKRLVNEKISDLEKLSLRFTGSIVLLGLDDIHICFEKKTTDNWTITYKQVNTTIETVDLEKSIIDHLWFVLKNPNIKLKNLGILDCESSKAEKCQMLDSEKLNILLQSMIDSIDHQIHTNVLDCESINEDVFLSMLKHVEPGTLENISFNISWKEEGNYRKMKEIVETDQWKQAKTILAHGVTPSKMMNFDEFFQYKSFCLKLNSVTPEDVLVVVEHTFNSSCPKRCSLSSEHEKYDIDAIVDFLQSQNDGSKITKINPNPPQFKFAYTIVKCGKRVQLVGDGSYIGIGNY